jgi:hypothetical protein
MSLEHIVRPVVVESLRPAPQNGLRTPNSDTEEAILEWGRSGDSIFTISASAHQEAQNPDHTEVSRKVDVVRVKNPDDEEQFVDVEVMREYRGINKATGEKFNLAFDNVPTGPQVEVIKSGVFRESDIQPISSTSSGDL